MPLISPLRTLLPNFADMAIPPELLDVTSEERRRWAKVRPKEKYWSLVAVVSGVVAVLLTIKAQMAPGQTIHSFIQSPSLWEVLLPLVGGALVYVLAPAARWAWLYIVESKAGVLTERYADVYLQNLQMAFELGRTVQQQTKIHNALNEALTAGRTLQARTYDPRMQNHAWWIDEYKKWAVAYLGPLSKLLPPECWDRLKRPASPVANMSPVPVSASSIYPDVQVELDSRLGTLSSLIRSEYPFPNPFCNLSTIALVEGYVSRLPAPSSPDGEAPPPPGGAS